ncbi:DoxX family protein [Micromonospora sp. LOL_021]|uniref:DoxX family protein n=1 Tax=Micromonospora sp. LOL_021 TaxID=3345417 RepID=UPI003A8B3899
MSTDAVRPGRPSGDMASDSTISRASEPAGTGSEARSAQDPWIGAGLLALRAAVGTTFLLHGIQNVSGAWTGWDAAAMSEYLSPKGFGGAATAVSWFLALAQVTAGLMILLGLFTAVGAVVVVVPMATSAFTKLSVGFFMPGGFEWELAVMAGGLTLLLAGAGQYSLDHLKIPERTVARARLVAVALTVVITLAMIVVTWGAPPPQVPQ